MNSTDNPDVVKALDKIAQCIAFLAVNSDTFKGKAMGDLIPMLDNLGFDNTAIASILNTTPESISARKSQVKKKKTTPKRKKGHSSEIEPV